MAFACCGFRLLFDRAAELVAVKGGVVGLGAGAVVVMTWLFVVITMVWAAGVVCVAKYSDCDAAAAERDSAADSD
jgi:hypothetical protein